MKLQLAPRTPLVPFIITGPRTIDPPHHFAIGEIDIHTTAEIVVLIARGSQPERRPEIMSVGGTSRIAFRIIRLPPHKQEGFRAHPDSGPATADRLLIQRIKGRKALD